MILIPFKNLTERDKSDAIEKLISESTPSSDFFLMIVLSILMATLGILLDSITIVIGSMLIAPLLSPILSLSLGIIMSDHQLISRSLSTILRSMMWGIFASGIVTLIFFQRDISSTFFFDVAPSFLYMGVAIVAGFAATFALVKPRLNEMLPGVAISVALIPPLALIGIGIAKLSWVMITNSFLIFLLNAIGIIFASMITFSLMNFYVKRGIAKETIKEEDERVEKEEADAEKEMHE